MRFLAPLLSLSLGACSLVSAPPQTELPLPEVNYTQFTLDNGLRLIVHEDHSTPLVAVNIWYHVGSKNEQAGKTGFAHLFEHLMFNGSENYDDEFFLPLEEVGATGMNGTTNADRTNYFATVPTNALDRLLWLESDRMGHLLGAINQAKLDEQRGVVQNEKRQGQNRPYGQVRELIPQYSYPPEHPYSWPTIGSMDDLNAATLDDVKTWFKTWYGAANAVVVIAGDITAADAKQKVEQYFGDIPAGPQLQRPTRWPAPMAANRQIEIQDQVPQSRSYFVWNVAANYTQDLVHLQLAADALANGKNSRLYQQLVYNEQTAVNVGAYVHPREMGSQFVVYVTAKPEADMAELEAKVDAAVQQLINSGPTEKELERSRTGTYVGLIRGMEKLGGYGSRTDLLASSLVLTGRADTWRQELEWLRAATPQTVTASLENWLQAGRLLLRVNPLTEHKHAEQGADRSRLPAAGPGKALQLPELQRATLSNGLRVILAERHNVPMLEMRLLLDGSGYSADPNGKEGLANLTMQLLDEGAGSRNSLQLSERLEELGASLSSGASLDQGQISLSVVKPMLKPALELFADVIQRPHLPAEELDRLRPRILASIAQEQANPINLALRALPPLLYGDDHPYGQPMTGSGRVESIQQLSREDVQSFYQAHIRPQNAQLLVVGDISQPELLPLLEQHFAQWQSETESNTLEISSQALPEKPRIFLLNRPGAPQSLILAGHLAPARDDALNLEMKMANGVLGGAFTSRINMNLREEKHWAYGAGSALIDTKAQRPFIVYGQVQADKTVDAMLAIRTDLQQMLSHRPIETEELKRVVKNETLSLPGRNETLGQIANSISRILSRGLPDDYFDQLVLKLNDMSAEQAQQGAHSLIQPKALTWLVIGDMQEHGDAIRALQWGEITELDAKDL